MFLQKKFFFAYLFNGEIQFKEGVQKLTNILLSLHHASNDVHSTI